MITTDQVIEVALRSPWSATPTNDLLLAVWGAYGVTFDEACRAVNQALQEGVIKHEWSKQSDPTQRCWDIQGAVWRKNEPH